jgi:hypothetical protein
MKCSDGRLGNVIDSSDVHFVMASHDFDTSGYEHSSNARVHAASRARSAEI